MRTKALLCVSLIILTAAQNVVKAQNLTTFEVENPMLKEGKSWNYEYHHFEENENEPPTEIVYPVRYTIIGDTVIDNKSYYKMFQDIDNQKTYYAAYREEGLKVFVRYPLIDEDIIVADFEYEGLYDPNGYEENDPYSAIKEYIDYIEVDGIQYKRHTYYENDKEMKLVIGVEGIGYTNYGLMYPSLYGAQPDCVCDFKIFSSCEVNGKCIFTKDDFYKAVSAHPNEYTDPKTNVVYTYEPGRGTASVKAGYEEVVEGGHDGHEWETIYHSGCPDATGNVVILDKITIETTEYVVTSIGEGAFYKNMNIKSVSIPETVTDIGEGAFRSCENLTTVHIPEGLTKIAPCLFNDCSQLVSVNIPSSVSTIGYAAFAGCSSLSDLTLPANLVYVGFSAFTDTPWYDKQYNEAPDGPFYIGQLLFRYKGAKPVGELVIREGTTCVCYGAFSGCDGLTSVTFPQSISYVDSDAFFECTNLTAVHISDLAAWCRIEFQRGNQGKSSNPLFYANHLYLNGEEVTDLVIPEGVTSIGDYAFDKCTTLTSVTLPNSITSIGSHAFQKCDNLASITIPPSVEIIGSNAFLHCFNLNAVHISDLAAWCGISFDWTANPLYYGARLYVGDEEVTGLVVPEGVAAIGDAAFIGSRLTSVTIPDGVTSIGEGSFKSCSDLSEVNIPASVKSIGNEAFFECKSLTNIFSLIEEPFEIADEVFERYEYDSKTYASATLHVPKGSKARYEATNGWKKFQNIVEMDNDDEIPNAKDIAAIVNVIIGKTTDEAIKSAADQNGDGVVNIADIVKIVNEIMGK